MKEKRYSKKQMIGAALFAVALTLTVVLIGLVALLGREGIAVAEGFALTRLLFVGEADMKTAADGALSALADATGDRWSYYLDRDWNASNEQYKANEATGIGVRVLYRDEGLLVTDVVPEGGAAQAGIQSGEYLTAVEGAPLYGEERRANVEKIAGEAGTQVLLTVRDAGGEERQVSALRGTWFDPPIRAELLDGQVGYVRIFNFNSGVSEAFASAVDALLEQGASAFVFDVRQNGGGYVDELAVMLDYLLPEGVVFRQKTSWGWSFQKQSGTSCVDVPMAVLLDAESYSAAELFAAQLRESAGAYLVGEHTSGKGYFQYPFQLSNGGSLGLSIGTYTTGNGVSLIGTGVEPDEVLSLSEEENTLLAARWLSREEDPQLRAARTWLAGQSE